ncbi:hypothetical protein KU306_12080 [Haloferax larsenii]|uniref:Uncharacterized protein n=1 Tax=Haloferax larsenii TaxID=302484 RepID=A0ABY5RBF2_HALLR|nr:hypothetical protein [Haloferax larsenii]UVE49642.1 hypothetical protein KU306_12080 [Haloferax larsenii]
MTESNDSNDDVSTRQIRWNAEWRLTDDERELMAAIVNLDCTTWAQLDEEYERPPSKLMPRLKAMAAKFRDATEYADDIDFETYTSLTGSDRERAFFARSYAGVWEMCFEGAYTDLVAEYTQIYDQ